MKLIANITLVTVKGEIPPGGEYSTKDAAEAESLIARGFAYDPAAKAEPEADAPLDPSPQP